MGSSAQSGAFSDSSGSSSKRVLRLFRVHFHLLFTVKHYTSVKLKSYPGNDFGILIQLYLLMPLTGPRTIYTRN